MRPPLDFGWIDLAGYAASALVFLTFYMRTMIPLRVVGILSNVAFMTYGLAGQVYPVFILHAILLPMNCVRLVQMRALIKKVRDAAHKDDFSMEWLVPFMQRRSVARGQVLFRRGDPADELFVVLVGSLRLVDVAITVGPGSVLGEIGIFAPNHQRMDTAICETDVDLAVIANDKVLELYHQNPKLGMYLIRLVAKRLLDNYVALRDASLASRGQSSAPPTKTADEHERGATRPD
jgi:CRP/FNR family transcriptional regulator, cyclic AMP receptor protein